MAVDHRFIPKALLVAACTLVSRVLGLARDVLTSAVFGASATMDMFIIAFTVPNLFRKLFGEGTLNSAFIPVLTQEIADPDRDERLLIRATLTALAALLGLLTLVGWAACAAVLLLAAHTHLFTLSPNGRLLCLLLAIMLPYMPLICMAALLGAALNTRDRFLAPALAPALLNLCWILAVWLFSGRFHVYALAWGVLVGGAVQFALQAPFIWRCQWQIRPLWDWAHPGLRRMVRLILPVIVGLGVIQINVALDRIIAEVCVPGSGANSVLFFGNRLMQFPLGVLGLALATAVFPAYARHAAAGDREGLADTINAAVRIALFIALPCMAVMLTLHLPIVSVVFQRRAFSPEAAARTARVLFYYGMGLWAFCGIHVLARAFHALQDTRTPVKAASAMVALNLVLNLILVWPMREAGLALSSSIAAAGNVVLLAVFLRKRTGPLGGRNILLSATKNAVAAALAGLAGYSATAATAGRLGLTGRFQGPLVHQIAALGIGLSAAGAVFLAATWLVRGRELREFVAAVRRGKKP